VFTSRALHRALDHLFGLAERRSSRLITSFFDVVLASPAHGSRA
jgi:hypothetical protein